MIRGPFEGFRKNTHSKSENSTVSFDVMPSLSINRQFLSVASFDCTISATRLLVHSDGSTCPFLYTFCLNIVRQKVAALLDYEK